MEYAMYKVSEQSW